MTLIDTETGVYIPFGAYAKADIPTQLVVAQVKFVQQAAAVASAGT